MKRKLITCMLLVAVTLFQTRPASGQTPYSLGQLIEAAGKNNHLLAIKEYQIREKNSKLKEDRIKKYPSPTIDGFYQYNDKLPEIAIPAGSLGNITSVNGSSQPLPAENSKFNVGQKSNYNVGLNLYQPLSQQFKINTGLAIDRTDIKLLQKEKEKSTLQIFLAVEQLYYNSLITQKQAEAETSKMELIKAKLYDAEGALAAGKTTGLNIAGLRADIAGQEQNLLQLRTRLEDYLSELSSLTHLKVTELAPVETGQEAKPYASADDYKSAAALSPDMEIARLNKEKATLGIKATRQSNLPELGLTAGYYVQQGNPLLAESSPYAGITLKWNIQDLFSNKQIKNQMVFQLKQAEENIAYTKQQVETEIDKAWRKVKQSAELISAAKILVSYRTEAMKEQQDKQLSGKDIKTAMLEIKSQLAEAEAGFYSAQLSHSIAMAQLRNLAGQRK